MTDKEKKQENIFHIKLKTKPSAIVAICKKLYKENKFKEIHLFAIGRPIENLVTIVEVLKAICPGLYQQNRISTVSYQSIEEGTEKVEQLNPKLYPKFEVTLSLEKPAEENEGYQDKLSEEERKNILETQAKIKEAKKEKKKAKVKRINGNQRKKSIGDRRYRRRGKSAINRRSGFSKKFGEKHYEGIRRRTSFRTRYRSHQKQNNKIDHKPLNGKVGINSGEQGSQNSPKERFGQKLGKRKYSGGLHRNFPNKFGNNQNQQGNNIKRRNHWGAKKSPTGRFGSKFGNSDNNRSEFGNRWGNGRRNSRFKKGYAAQRS